MRGRARLRNPRRRQSDIFPALPPKKTCRSWRSSVCLSEKLHHFSSMTLVNGGLSCTTQVFPCYSCMIYNLQGIALTCRVMGRVAAEHDDVHQAEWILNVMNNYIPEQSLFLDEPSKDDNACIVQRYKRAPPGECPFSMPHSRGGIRFSVLPGALTLLCRYTPDDPCGWTYHLARILAPPHPLNLTPSPFLPRQERKGVREVHCLQSGRTR